jgi:hypothetical protein
MRTGAQPCFDQRLSFLACELILLGLKSIRDIDMGVSWAEQRGFAENSRLTKYDGLIYQTHDLIIYTVSSIQMIFHGREQFRSITN